MGRRRAVLRAVLVCVALGTLMVGFSGCGYARNVRDDLMDCGTLAVGVVPPVVPGDDTTVVGPLPPAIGAYAEMTEFFHLGALFKATGDLEWDRRGLSATVDVRRKLGIGPFHDVYIQQTPALANPYKETGNQMDGWRRHMADLEDPLFNSPAKVLIFEPEDVSLASGYGEEQFTWKALPWMSKGWQDWETFSLEVAVPEPFILHSGLYLRAGVDPSQVFDLVLSVFGVDFYQDAAYNAEGTLKY